MFIRGQRWEQVYNLAWILLGLLICIQSGKLRLWGSSGPGSGFIPFGAGLFIGGCGILLFVLEWLKGSNDQPEEPFWDHPGAPKRTLYILMGFFAMALLMPLLGFFLTSLVVMTIMVRMVKPQRIGRVLLVSIPFCCFIYFFFHYIFDIKLPKGVLNF